jgi:hypothetical protein
MGKRLVFRVRYQRHKKQVDGIREAEATRDGSKVNHHQSFCQICKRIFNRLTYLSTQGAAPSSEGAAQTEATETVPDAAVDQLVVRGIENRFHTRPTNGQQPCNVPKTWLVNSHRSPNRHPTRRAKPERVSRPFKTMSVILILRHHPSNQSRAIECCKRLERVKDLQRYEYEPTEITVASARFRTIVPTLDWPEDGARVDTESRRARLGHWLN